MGGYNFLKFISAIDNEDFIEKTIDINKFNYDYLNSIDFFKKLSMLNQKEFNEEITKQYIKISSKQCIEDAVIGMLDNLNHDNIKFLEKYHEYILERVKKDPKEYFNNSYLVYIDYFLEPETYSKLGFKRSEDSSLLWNDKVLIPSSNWQLVLDEINIIKEKIKANENLKLKERMFFEEYTIFSVYCDDLKLKKEDMPIILKYFNKYPLNLEKDLGLTRKISHVNYKAKWDNILAIQKDCNKIKNWILKFLTNLSFSLYDIEDKVDIRFFDFRYEEVNEEKNDFAFTGYDSVNSTYNLQFYGMNFWRFWGMIHDSYLIYNYLSQVYLGHHEVAHIVGGHKRINIENSKDEREKRIAQEEYLIANNRTFYVMNHHDFYEEIEADDVATTKLWLEYHEIFPMECLRVINDIKKRPKRNVGLDFSQKIQEEYEKTTKRLI